MGQVRGRRIATEVKLEIIELIEEAIFNGAGKRKCCDVVGISLRTFERWLMDPHDKRQGPLKKPLNALTTEERQNVLDVANKKEYVNLSPSQIVPKLADKNIYIASESTFYRILKVNNMLAHRSKSAPKENKKPEPLSATRPNQVWTWDITYLKANVRGTFYYLYLPMDIFSRKIVHWEIHERESSEIAATMIRRAIEKNNVEHGSVVLHSDNGGPMKGATMLATLQLLGVVASFSRPSVSNDNPFSESLFKTLKYFPSYPEKNFGSIEEAKSWVEKFVDYYNNHHLHSGVGFVTPEQRHNGEYKKILANRENVYLKAKKLKPERWSGKIKEFQYEKKVFLNPNKQNKSSKKRLAA